MDDLYEVWNVEIILFIDLCVSVGTYTLYASEKMILSYSY